jgi:hypothetical protein
MEIFVVCQSGTFAQGMKNRTQGGRRAQKKLSGETEEPKTKGP